ncbi:amidohydrolase [Elizabethkingia argentiflava]|uniref:Omega-amidase YafV n=1 Tax=Elizabethkingia argenteiflava TaxID=2681556 RepID=A0A845PTY1_9FLAO|nr:amidohydrolase [Elizabethkingia argenteiflava]NAW50491.1 amidohydrolase [Elizabethkingia argenteiflava]
MRKLKILGLQHNIQWRDKVKNLERIESLFSTKEKPDIFLLPEMFATGFCMDAQQIADKKEEILSWMRSFAIQHKVAVGGSVAIEHHQKFYNRFYFVEKGGKTHHYDKRHLFSYAREDQYYTPGKKRVVIEYLGWKICLQVCYDLRFPVFSRNTDDYHLMLNIANWPSSRIDAWDSLLKARALENQCYVFGLNRLGEDGEKLHYTGSSHCFFADGREVGRIEDTFISAELDQELLHQHRMKFPFLADRDDFEL